MNNNVAIVGIFLTFCKIVIGNSEPGLRRSNIISTWYYIRVTQIIRLVNVIRARILSSFTRILIHMRLLQNDECVYLVRARTITD